MIWPVALVPSIFWNVFIFQLIGLLGLLALPVAVALAILRYRLYDIDVVINRAIVYAALSVVLLGTYAVLVITVGALARPVTGSGDLAVAGSTVVVLLLFQPLRTWIQRAVDRQFYRSRYDAQRTVDAFTERLRDEIDLAALEIELTRVVYAALRPTHVSVWLRADLRGRNSR